MISEIIKLRNEGMSFREIAKELNSTVGKVHYQWIKHEKDEPSGNESPVQSPLTSNDFLPSSYNQDRMHVLVKNSSTIYVYWEISDIKLSFLQHTFKKGYSQLPKFIKIYDVTSVIFNGSNAHRQCEISLPEMTNNWFVSDLEPNRTYVAEYGVKTDHGNFFTVLRSNPIDTPRNSPEQVGLFTQNVHQWKTGSQSSPGWLEQFSTYSYYEKVK
ncbi:hypothetical protein JOC85_001610 [Bacillus mesophilus]|uniref:DUF4912 domain-containing protein n=1 Tax=Bacillus mesophilus TaxID=1808955 RepID=A0A6M0Q5L1_9BACI|nr:hypothetical protein [Bacillus mesophilus]NEY71615.1 DUF4912 domain-containing protein [Bacillus mesophilus]